MERGVSAGVVLAEVCDLPECGANRTGKRLVVNCVGKLFSFYTVLLGGEGQGDKGGGEEAGEGDEEDVSVMPSAHFEFDVTEAKRVLSIAGCIGIFC